jgi:hypothetical protein
MQLAALAVALFLMTTGTPARAYPPPHPGPIPPPWVIAQQQALIAAQQQAIQRRAWAVAQQQAWVAAQEQQAAWLAAQQQAAWLEAQQRAAWRAARRQAIEQAALQRAAEEAAAQKMARTLVTLVNPGRNGGAVNYTVDGRRYTLWPDRSQPLLVTADSIITFHRGRSLGMASYRLPEGTYHFVADGRRGWDLLPADQAEDRANAIIARAAEPAE